MLNLNCGLLDPIYESASRPLYIREDVVDLKQQVTGKIGFCSIFDYYISLDVPFRYDPAFKGISIRGIFDDCNNLQNFFLNSVKDRIATDCRYRSSKESHISEAYRKYPLFLSKWETNPAMGYIFFYDERDSRGNWRMHPAAVNYFNKYFKSDYYLTGRLDLYYTFDSQRKMIEIEPNLLLILYDDEGYKVWSKLYKKKYDYIPDEVNKKDTSYMYVKQMIVDLSEEINRDLMFNQSSEVVQ